MSREPPAEDAGQLRRRATIGGFFLAGRTAVTQVCVLVANVALARLLTPKDFGVYAIVQFALAFFQFFGDAGVGGALVRKRERPSPDELSSVFVFQSVASLGVVALVWVAAPLVARVWPDLPPGAPMLLRAMACAFFFNSARVAPSLLMERDLQFGRIAVLDVLQTLAFYGVAVGAASAGLGIWTWAAAVLSQAIVGCFGAFVLHPWRPSTTFRWSVVRPLVAFGIPYQAKNLIGFANSAAAPLYAGAKLGAYDLGLVNFGQQTAYFPLKLVEVVSRVSFPLYARLQDRPAELAAAVRRALQISAIGTCFCVALFLGMGANVVTVIYTAKWLPALVPLYAYAIAIGIGFVSPLVGSAFDAIGRPDIFARLALFWTVLNWIVVPLTTARWGAIGFIAGNCVHVVVGNALVLWLAPRFLPGLRLARAFVGPIVGGALVFGLARWVGRGVALGPTTLTLAIVALVIVQVLPMFVTDRDAARAVLTGLLARIPGRRGAT